MDYRLSSLAFICWMSAVLGFGCSASFNAQHATTTTPAYLRTIVRVDTTNHLAYMGSDGSYHYVFHVQIGDGGSFRVPISEWQPPRTFPVGQGDPYVVNPLMLSGQHRP